MFRACEWCEPVGLKSAFEVFPRGLPFFLLKWFFTFFHMDVGELGRGERFLWNFHRSAPLAKFWPWCLKEIIRYYCCFCCFCSWPQNKTKITCIHINNLRINNIYTCNIYLNIFEDFAKETTLKGRQGGFHSAVERAGVYQSEAVLTLHVISVSVSKPAMMHLDGFGWFYWSLFESIRVYSQELSNNDFSDSLPTPLEPSGHEPPENRGTNSWRGFKVSEFQGHSTSVLGLSTSEKVSES